MDSEENPLRVLIVMLITQRFRITDDQLPRAMGLLTDTIVFFNQAVSEGRIKSEMITSTDFGITPGGQPNE